MNPLKKELYYQWFLLIRRCWKLLKIRFIRKFIKKTDKNKVNNEINLHFLQLKANIYNDFYLALKFQICKKNINLKFVKIKKYFFIYLFILKMIIHIKFIKIKEYIYIYLFLIYFINYQKKDKYILKYTTYIEVSCNHPTNLDEKMFETFIFKHFFKNEFNLKTFFVILKHIFFLYVYIIYLWIEYILITNFKWNFVYEFNLFLYWIFDTRFDRVIFIRNLYFRNWDTIIDRIKDRISLRKRKNLQLKEDIKKKIYKSFLIKKKRFIYFFVKKYEKRFIYFSYLKIIINKIIVKLKYYKVKYFTYQIWKWYFYLKYLKYRKLYYVLSMSLIKQKLMINFNIFLNIYYYIFPNISYIKKYVYYKILNKYFILKNILKKNIYKIIKYFF